MMSEITITDVYQSAWKKLAGSKKSIWAIAIVILLLIFTMAYFSNLIKTESLALHYWTGNIVLPIILYLVIGPFYAGAVMVAIKRFRQENVDIKTGYEYFQHYLMIAITMGIIGVISNIISIIINVPTIAQTLGGSLPYFDLLSSLFSLMIYSLSILTIPLIIDKNNSIRDAFITSFRKVKPYYWRVFIIFLVTYVILFLIYFPAILGVVLHNGLITLLGGIFFIAVLIWFLPFLFLLIGNIYHRLVDDAVLTD